jgi:hypothetical protein
MAVRENKVKVQEYLDKLNGSTKPKLWVAGDGFHVMNGFDFGIDGDGFSTATFHADTGYPVKLFINVETGEVRAVGAFKFKD